MPTVTHLLQQGHTYSNRVTPSNCATLQGEHIQTITPIKFSLVLSFSECEGSCLISHIFTQLQPIMYTLCACFCRTLAQLNSCGKPNLKCLAPYPLRIILLIYLALCIAADTSEILILKLTVPAFNIEQAFSLYHDSYNNNRRAACGGGNGNNVFSRM